MSDTEVEQAYDFDAHPTRVDQLESRLDSNPLLLMAGIGVLALAGIGFLLWILL